MRLLVPLLLLALSLRADARDFRLELVRESLTGTHCRDREYIGGIPTEHYETRPCSGVSMAMTDAPPVHDRMIIEGRVTRRVVIDDWAHFYDEQTGALVRRVPLVHQAKPARVFDPNPVAAINNPTLVDQNDAASAVPEQAYRLVQLDSVRGPHVTIIERQLPNVAPVSDDVPSFVFNREEEAFEDVNAAFHIDRSQRHLQALGYTGARGVVPYAIEVDTHAASGRDASFYSQNPATPGRGALLYGTGGVDDAEDADIVLHEYGHAIHDWIAPGTFSSLLSSEARAMSEGFSDYWAFSAGYAQRVASGRDPFCIGDWDARCWQGPSESCGYAPGSDCLRRTDSAKTMAEFERVDSGGSEHRNGEIWSSMLTRVFLDNVVKYGMTEGRRITDTIVIESFFGAPSAPTFGVMAARMLAADRRLFGGAHVNTITNAARARAIVLVEENALVSRDVVWFQSLERRVAIPENDVEGTISRVRVDRGGKIEQLYVRVDVAHTSRGDLRLTLIAPDGTEVLLHQSSNERAPDLRVTYGIDAASAQSLTALHGRDARGEWKLRVADVRTRDVGTLRSWELIIDFESNDRGQRNPAISRSIVPVVTHVRGANGTEFRSQLRITNRDAATVWLTLFFTPSGADGTTTSFSTRAQLLGGQTLVFDDVLRDVFGLTGSGALEVSGGDVITVTSRTYNLYNGGTVGQLIGGYRVFSNAARALHLRNDARFRSNVGYTEAVGRAGNVTFDVYDGNSGVLLSTETHTLAPFSHLQVPVRASGESLVVRVHGDASGIVYGSLVDNTTGDPTTIDAVSAPFFPAISASGANGTHWRTELAIVRIEESESAGTLPVTWTDAVTGETIRTTVPDPAVNRSVRVDDVVATLFDRAGHLGTVSVGATPAHIVFARVGTNGVHTALPGRERIRGRSLYAAENNTAFRTNIGIYADTNARVRIVVYDATGAEVEAHQLDVAAFDFVSIPVRATVSDGWVDARVLSGSAQMYASVVDNVTGDATTD